MFEKKKTILRIFIFSNVLFLSPTFEVAALCLQILPLVLFVKESTVLAIIFSEIPIYLVPVLNLLGTILLIKPYRQSLFEIFKRFQANVSESLPQLSTKGVQKEGTVSVQQNQTVATIYAA